MTGHQWASNLANVGGHEYYGQLAMAKWGGGVGLGAGG